MTLFIAILLLAAIAFIVVKASGKKEQTATAIKPEATKAPDTTPFIQDVNTRAACRWPVTMFPYGVSDATNKEHAGSIDALLRKYPEAPVTDEDVDNNEKIFWREYAEHFSVDRETGKVLRKTGDLIDFYCNEEIYVLASYYAATGKYREPLRGPKAKFFSDKYTRGKEQRLQASWLYDPETGNLKAKPSRTDYQTRHLHEAGERAAAETIKSALDELEKYMAEGKVSRMEKGGRWFATNVAEAFNVWIKGPPADFGPQTATGPENHPAGSELAYKPAT